MIWSSSTQSALAAPFQTRNGPSQLGRALWLYLALVHAANDQGLVVRTRNRLASELSVAETSIDEWLARLIKADLIRVLSPAPYLAVKLRSWSGEGLSLEENPKAIEEGNSHSSAAAIALSSNAGERGQGKGEDMANALRAVLPGAEPAEIERILTGYPHPIIRKTLDRVNNTPPNKIRKSKTALFRFLLAKFSQEIDVNEL